MSVTKKTETQTKKKTETQTEKKTEAQTKKKTVGKKSFSTFIDYPPKRALYTISLPIVLKLRIPSGLTDWREINSL